MVAPLTVRAVNIHDTALFPHSFDALMDIADVLDLDMKGAYMTLDSGFDSMHNKWLVDYCGLIPVIKPNRRNMQPAQLNEVLDAFEEVKDIYKRRYIIERTFAWQDTYRKLVIRYEKLQCTFLGFRYLAYSMINFRGFFKDL